VEIDMENHKDRERRTVSENELESNEHHGRVSNGSESASAGAAVGADSSSSYDKLLQEKQDLYDRLLRKQAELENFRKRIQREKEDFLQHATTDLVRALLPTLDGFERALKHRDPAVPEQFYKGMKLIYKQLSDVLSRAGLVPVESAGQAFDPHLHQAVETVESPAHRENEVVEELQKGYKLKQRLLRPAIVKVAVGSQNTGHQSRSKSAPGTVEASTTEAGED
jgi:molecular chaperone GrpE